MKNIIFMFGLGAFPLLSGCIAATEAVISNHDDGMHQTQLNQYTYLLSYKGHSWNNPEEEKRILLTKAAEITQQNGYKYFTVIGSGTNSTYQQYTSPGTATYNDYGYGVQEQIRPGQTYNINRSITSMTFQIIPHPKNISNLLDASIILSSR